MQNQHLDIRPLLYLLLNNRKKIAFHIWISPDIFKTPRKTIYFGAFKPDICFLTCILLIFFMLLLSDSLSCTADWRRQMLTKHSDKLAWRILNYTDLLMKLHQSCRPVRCWKVNNSNSLKWWTIPLPGSFRKVASLLMSSGVLNKSFINKKINPVSCTKHWKCQRALTASLIKRWDVSRLTDLFQIFFFMWLFICTCWLFNIWMHKL